MESVWKAAIRFERCSESSGRTRGSRRNEVHAPRGRVNASCGRPAARRISEAADVEGLELEILLDPGAGALAAEARLLDAAEGRATVVEIAPVLSPTMPNSSASPTRQPGAGSRCRSRPRARWVPLASAIASSSVSKRKSGATGPKVSSEASAISVVAPVSTIGVAYWPAGTSARANTVAPLASVLDVAVDLLDGGVDHRADLDAGGGARADLHRPHPRRQPLGEGVVHAPLHQDAVGADAGLAAVAELRGDRPSTAASRSASSATMKGALPPSSSESRFTLGADCAIKSDPTRVEPVKEILRTPSLPVSSAPISAGSPVTTLTTPAGMPARSARTPSASAEKGDVRWLDHHGAAGGERRRDLAGIIAFGKFQGVMMPETPTGCFSVTMRRSGVGEGITDPSIRRASSANHFTKEAP